MSRQNNAVLSFTAVAALIDALIPVVAISEGMANKSITFFLILASFPASGIQAYTEMYFQDNLLVKISGVAISFLIIWPLFYLLWTHQISKWFISRKSTQ